MKALITGARRGLGLRLVETSLDKGHEVLAAYRGQAGQTLLDLKKEHADRLHLLELDVECQDSVRDAAEQTRKKVSQLDVLINNAGILRGRGQTIETLSFEDLDASIKVNAFGPLRVIQSFLPLLRQSPNPVIVNVSSDAGSIEKSVPDDYAYAMSKTLLNKASESLRKHLQPQNFKVMSVHPGWMRTDMGGQEAHEDPAIIAGKIFDLIEGPCEALEGTSYIDFDGHRMPY